MARSTRPDPANIAIALKVSKAEAAQIDEVLARPEFAGWTRSEWSREIIRTALSYYARNPPAADSGQTRGPARPAPAQPLPPTQPAAASAPLRAGGNSGPAGAPGASPPVGAEPMPPEPPALDSLLPEPGRAEPLTAEPLTAEPLTAEPLTAEPLTAEQVRPEPGPPPRPDCSHPAEARDYEHGVCAACGAVLWD